MVRRLLPCRRVKPSYSRCLLALAAIGCGPPTLTEVFVANVDRVTALSLRSRMLGVQSGNGVCAARSQRYDFERHTLTVTEDLLMNRRGPGMWRGPRGVLQA